MFYCLTCIQNLHPQIMKEVIQELRKRKVGGDRRFCYIPYELAKSYQRTLESLMSFTRREKYFDKVYVLWPV